MVAWIKKNLFKKSSREIDIDKKIKSINSKIKNINGEISAIAIIPHVSDVRSDQSISPVAVKNTKNFLDIAFSTTLSKTPFFIISPYARSIINMVLVKSIIII